MHQNFTGSSRKPRRVDLSGRPGNPFASLNSSSIGSAGPQAAIASAQQERLARQQQRERLQATNRIQRVWRGHSARRKSFKEWRKVWDKVEGKATQGDSGYQSEEDSLRQLQRLLLFFSPRDESDRKRLTWYGMRQQATSERITCEGGPWPKAYLKLERSSISALRERNGTRDPEVDRHLLMVTAFAARRTQLSQKDAVAYYRVLAELTDLPEQDIQNAILAPLQTSTEAYTGLAVLLSRPLEMTILTTLRMAVDPTAMLQAFSTSIDGAIANTPRAKLWLLGNILHMTNGRKSEALTFTIARLLGSLADDVEFESEPIDLDNIVFDSEVLSKVSSGLPLNFYLHQETNKLINQASIRNLLVRHGSNIYPNGNTGGTITDSLLLAGYALTLLRCFPRRADDIRMWLYLGPTNRSSTSNVPATQYFWSSVKQTTVFTTIHNNSRAVVSLLKGQGDKHQRVRDDWTIILIFLELYTFLLKIIDDEEFVGSSERSSAIPLPDVAALVTFLKNLGFTLYFNAADLNNTDEMASRDAPSTSLGRYFGNSTEAAKAAPPPAESKPLIVAGLPGLTMDYLKGVVTGLLRQIYERDSRRRFLPQNHWLMTSRFDMTSFIPGVVAEEESRHQVQEQDDEDKDIDDDDDLYEPATPLFSPRSQGRINALRSQEARARDQRKASRKRYLESVAPRLEILQNMPFFIPFHTRVEIFRQFVHLDQIKRRNGVTDPDLWRHLMMTNPANLGPNGMPMHPGELLARHHAKIRRKNEFKDAFIQYYELGADLKEPIQITFEDEFGFPEAGIDGGGVTKEFLTSVISQAFDPTNSEIEHQFFIENETHLLHPNPTAIEDLKVKWHDLGFKPGHHKAQKGIKTLLQQYEFLGRIIGKCLYEGILVDVSFAGFFLKKWALTGGTNQASLESGYRANINDLRELDEGLYKGLLSLKNCAPEDVASLGLTFAVDDQVGPDEHKEVVEVELMRGGANMPVTAENRLLYINAMSRYRLQGQSAPQTQAFLKGLGSIIQPSWLNMFNQSELQTLVAGAQAEINIADLRRNTLYGGTYVIGDDGLDHPTIQLFWAVMQDLPDEDRRAVLKFVTSTPRGPLLGFGQLNPRFSIRDSGSDENRWPSTSTCVNLLKLPMYRSENVLREKLLAAVRSGAGFDLS